MHKYSILLTVLALIGTGLHAGEQVPTLQELTVQEVMR